MKPAPPKKTSVERPTPKKAREAETAAGRLPRATAAIADTDRDGDDEHAAEFVELGPGELADERFAVTREIARGGMGRVLAAHDQLLDRTVALKEALGESPDELARFAREVQITAQLQHPSILPLYDARAWASGAPYYVMRLVSGEPLADKIAAASSLDERLTLVPAMLAAADALAFAHEKEIIHRDVKPSNILIGDHGETVVIDWGIAKVLEKSVAEDDAEDVAESVAESVAEDDVANDLDRSDDERAEASEASDETRPGAILGTPGYMSPEQAAGDPADKRSDVYALGATLYHLLAGQRPFEGTTSRLIMARQLAGPPEPLTQHVKGVPGELLAIVDRALGRDPGDRYPDAAAFAEDLRRFQTGRLVAAHDYSVAERLVRFVRRHRAALLVAAIAAALLATVITSAVIRVRGERDLAVAASGREAERADELLIARAKRLLEVGEPTKAVALLKHLPLISRETTNAGHLLAEARRAGTREQINTHRAWAAFAWHPHLPILMSAGEREVKLHDVRGARPVTRTLATFDSIVASAAFVDAGRAVAVAPGESRIVIVDIGDGSREDLVTESRVIALAASAAGDFIVWREASGALWRRDIARGSRPRQLGFVGAGAELVISRDGALIAASATDGPATLWRGDQRFEALTNGWSPVLAVDDAGRATALFLGEDVVVEYVFDAAEPRERRRWKVPAVTRAARGEDGDVFATAFDARLDARLYPRLYKLGADGEVSKPWGERAVRSIFESEDGLLASGKTLSLLERGDREIALGANHRGIPRIASGHGLLAVGEHGGHAAIYRIADLVESSFNLADVKFAKYAGSQLALASGPLGKDIYRYVRGDARPTYAGRFAALPFLLRPSNDGVVLSLHGPISELLRLRDGATEPIDLRDEIAAFTPDRGMMFVRGNGLFRYQPFADLPPELLFTATEPIVSFSSAGPTLAVVTETGRLIRIAESGDETIAELGDPNVAYAIDGDAVFFAVGRELFVLRRLAPIHLATLPERPIALGLHSGRLFMFAKNTATRLTESGELVSLRVNGIRSFAGLGRGGRAVVLTERGEVLLLDFEREESQPLVSRRPLAVAISVGEADDVAVIRGGSRIDILEPNKIVGPAKLRALLEEATSATIDPRTEELAWP